MNKRKLLSFKVALGGVVAALSLLLMISAGVTSTLVYAIPMITGALLMMLVVEFGHSFAVLIYIAVSIISLLILGNKEAAVMYVGFFGYYPIIKSLLEKHIKGFCCWIIKYLIFNAAMVGSYFVVTKLFMISFEDLESFGKLALPLLLLAGNVLFAMYDVVLTRLVSIYLYRWRKYIKRVFK
ncbi:MAG: hypothetical protein IJZ16_12310 [Clostridia bacterium]|nr:hypothetical protein [Clostridia bacterium]